MNSGTFNLLIKRWGYICLYHGDSRFFFEILKNLNFKNVGIMKPQIEWLRQWSSECEGPAADDPLAEKVSSSISRICGSSTMLLFSQSFHALDVSDVFGYGWYTLYIHLIRHTCLVKSQTGPSLIIILLPLYCICMLNHTFSPVGRNKTSLYSILDWIGSSP